MDDIVKKNIQAYDKTVEEYFENTKELEEVEYHQRHVFLSQLPEEGRILDLGCGPGRDARIFSEEGYQVVGVDLSPKMIKMARAVAPKAKFKVMDFLHLDFEEKSFDAVWFNAGLLCVEKKHAKKILISIHKILKDGGILFVSVKQGRGEGFIMDERYGVEKYYSFFMEDELMTLLDETGFYTIETFLPELKSSYHEHQWIGVLSKKV